MGVSAYRQAAIISDALHAGVPRENAERKGFTGGSPEKDCP